MDPYIYLDSLKKYGSDGGFKPGFARINSLLNAFGNPERKLRVIHVGGSNGKGSTISFLKNVYREAGYSVGTYISPHLIEINERIEINGRYISTQELEEILQEMILVIERISHLEGVGEPSHFEVLTALSIIFFSRMDVDLAILEVGLGGRLDATNVIPLPLVSVITSISLEHTAILGDTYSDIAREKAGIIKEGCPVLTAVKNPEALKEIRKIALEKGSRLILIDEVYKYEVLESSLKGQTYLLIDNCGEMKLELSLLGYHQIRNSILAIAVIKELKEIFPVSERAIKAGMKKAYWPGRIEIVRENPLVLIDGAHNIEGIEALVDFLKKEFSPERKIRIILGVLNDKDIIKMLKTLNYKKENLDLFISKNKSIRALEPEIVKDIADREGITNSIYSSLQEAISSALKLNKGNDFICITGSLYTVTESKLFFERI
jgi:dihydrofolate synthase / folylpolyglutamate synthase